MARNNSFEEMQVYQKALEFGINVYSLVSGNFKISKDFASKDQVQRAASSISNNITEGFEQETKKELIRFLCFAKGLAGECRNILNFLSQPSNGLRSNIIEISQQLGNYSTYLKNLETQSKMK